MARATRSCKLSNNIDANGSVAMTTRENQTTQENANYCSKVGGENIELVHEFLPLKCIWLVTLVLHYLCV